MAGFRLFTLPPCLLVCSECSPVSERAHVHMCCTGNEEDIAHYGTDHSDRFDRKIVNYHYGHILSYKCNSAIIGLTDGDMCTRTSFVLCLVNGDILHCLTVLIAVTDFIGGFKGWYKETQAPVPANKTAAALRSDICIPVSPGIYQCTGTHCYNSLGGLCSLSRVLIVPAKAWYKETPGTCYLSSTAHAVMIPKVDYVTALAQKKFAVILIESCKARYRISSTVFITETLRLDGRRTNQQLLKAVVRKRNLCMQRQVVAALLLPSSGNWGRS
eukprot:1639507-Rhodomonas_salina.1